MTVYSYGQLETLWEDAGGSAALAPLMAAIAMAESGGNSDAYNPSGATGLWQILGAVNPADQDDLTDPAVNAKEAVEKYDSQGLDAWTTYTSGAYLQFYQGGVPASSLPQGGTGAQTTGAKSGLGLSLGGLTGLLSSGSDAYKSVYGMLAVPASVLNWIYEALQPSQEWRIVMFAGGTVSAGAAVWLYTGIGVQAGPVRVRSSQGATGSDARFSLAILLMGVSLLLYYTAFRPWPSAGGKPLRPAAYFVDVIKGQPPAPGTVTTNETSTIQKGLMVLIAAWATAQLLRVAAAGAGAIGQLFPGITSGEGGGGEPEPEPEPELPPIEGVALA